MYGMTVTLDSVSLATGCSLEYSLVLDLKCCNSHTSIIIYRIIIIMTIATGIIVYNLIQTIHALS